LRNKAEEIRKQMETVPGVVDLLVEPQTGVPQVQVNLNRQAAGALGVRAQDLAETVDAAFNGEAVSQVLENQRTFDLIVRFDDASRRSADTIASTLIDTPTGANVPLALIGGVVLVFLSGGTLSIASLIGFITLFGIATHNGIMLVTHYQHLIHEENVPFREAIVRGSLERLSPILMTALVTAVG